MPKRSLRLRGKEKESMAAKKPRHEKDSQNSQSSQLITEDAVKPKEKEPTEEKPTKEEPPELIESETPAPTKEKDIPNVVEESAPVEVTPTPPKEERMGATATEGAEDGKLGLNTLPKKLHFHLFRYLNLQSLTRLEKVNGRLRELATRTNAYEIHHLSLRFQSEKRAVEVRTGRKETFWLRLHADGLSGGCERFQAFVKQILERGGNRSLAYLELEGAKLAEMVILSKFLSEYEVHLRGLFAHGVAPSGIHRLLGGQRNLKAMRVTGGESFAQLPRAALAKLRFLHTSDAELTMAVAAEKGWQSLRCLLSTHSTHFCNSTAQVRHATRVLEMVAMGRGEAATQDHYDSVVFCAEDFKEYELAWLDYLQLRLYQKPNFASLTPVPKLNECAHPKVCPQPNHCPHFQGCPHPHCHHHYAAKDKPNPQLRGGNETPDETLGSIVLL